MTKADLARHVSRLARDTAEMTKKMVEGMHNPEFCASDATDYAVSFLSDLKGHVAHLEERLAEKKG